jgi:hypothetical protein
MISFEELAERHERLKRRIHAFRVPIRSRLGLFGVGVIYVTVPMVSGYLIMQWSLRIRDENLGNEGSGRSKLLEAQRRWAGGTGGGGTGDSSSSSSSGDGAGGGGVVGSGVLYRKDVPVPRRVKTGPTKEL